MSDARLQVGVFARLDRDNAQGGPTHRVADRVRIASIILVDLDGGRALLRVPQRDGMPKRFERSPPVLRPPARLHPEHPARQVRHRIPSLLTLHASAEHCSPSRLPPV